jgi:carboxyl-terminal processing protease
MSRTRCGLFIASLALLAPALAADADAERVTRLINQLASPKFAERRAATDALDAIGEPAIPALRKAAASTDDLEIRRRSGELVVRIERRLRAELLARLINQLGSTEFRERQAASDALEAIGKPTLPALRAAATSADNRDRARRAGEVVAAIEGRLKVAHTFAKRVLKATRLIHDDYIIEIPQGDLTDWAVRGLYEQLQVEVPAELEKRLRTVNDLKEEELGQLLYDARWLLGPREVELVKDADVALAVRALAGRLDPNCAYFDRDEIIYDYGVGRYGIGAHLRIDPTTRMAQVITPVKDGPAYQVGIRAGDIIETIIRDADSDGTPLRRPEVTPTQGMSVKDVSGKLLGKDKTKVRLRVRRPGEENSAEVTVVRAPVISETVLGIGRKDDDSPNFQLDRSNRIGYIRVTQFTRNTAKDVTRAVEELERDGLKGLVLDLRFNPGGLLQSAADTADLFIDDGEILRFRKRRGKDFSFAGTHEGSRLDFPVACLVNGGSSRAAEIVAGCLQDQKRALIIGERSAGEGSVQNILDLDGGQLKLTTAYFLRPSGKKIDRLKVPGINDDEWGITPDRGYRLDLSAEEREELRNHLDRQAMIVRRGQRAKEEEPTVRDLQLALALESVRARIK